MENKGGRQLGTAAKIARNSALEFEPFLQKAFKSEFVHAPAGKPTVWANNTFCSGRSLNSLGVFSRTQL